MSDDPVPAEVRSEEGKVTRMFVGGVCTSAVYGITMLVYSYAVRGALLEMKPDAFATYLSGMFAPLGFLWLVLGFRQQGHELKHSAEALWLQGQELQNSVEQQRQMVEVSRQQLEADRFSRDLAEEIAERDAQPKLSFSVGSTKSGDASHANVTIFSAGPMCSDVKVWLTDRVVATKAFLAPASEIRATSPDQARSPTKDVLGFIAYTDRRGNRRALKFVIPIKANGAIAGEMNYDQATKMSEAVGVPAEDIPPDLNT